MGWLKKIEQKARNEVKRVESDVRNEVKRVETDVRNEASRFSNDTLPEMLSWGIYDDLFRAQGRALNRYVGADAANIYGNYVLPAAMTVGGTIVLPGYGTAIGAGMGRFAGSQIAGRDVRYALEHAATDMALSGLAGAAGGAIAGGLKDAGMLASAANISGHALGSAGVNAALATARGQDPLDAAVIGGVSGGAGAAIPYLGGQIDSVTNWGRGSDALAGGLLGAGSAAGTNALLGNHYNNLGTLLGGASGAVSGYANSTRGQAPKEQTETPVTGGRLAAGMLLGGVQGVGDYFRSQASQPYVPMPINMLTAPTFGAGLLSSNKSQDDSDLNQQAQMLAWQRTANPMFSEYEQPVSETDEEEPDNKKPVTNNNFKRNNLAGWSQLA